MNTERCVSLPGQPGRSAELFFTADRAVTLISAHELAEERGTVHRVGEV